MKKKRILIFLIRFTFLSHYIEKKLILKSSLFDPEFYQAYYPDVKNLELNPLDHFIRIGAYEGRFASMKFSAGFYMKQYRDVLDPGLNPLTHYILVGKENGFNCMGNVELTYIDTARLIINSGLWDANYYLKNSGSYNQPVVDPLAHFIAIGGKEGKSPSGKFDAAYYLNRYQDVREARINPLVHYLKHGKKEGRYPTPSEEKDFVSENSNNIIFDKSRSLALYFDRVGFLTTSDQKKYLLINGWVHCKKEKPNLWIFLDQNKNREIDLRLKRKDVDQIYGEQDFPGGFSELIFLGDNDVKILEVGNSDRSEILYKKALNSLSETTFADKEYKDWKRINKLSKSDLLRRKDKILEFKYTPLVSIVMPVYNPGLAWLQTAVESVKDQIYPNWELCIADDASSNMEIIEYLKDIEHHSRINIKFRKTNDNISKTTNDAVKMASGEYLLFLDHDDRLFPNALYEIVSSLQSNPDADIIYTDHDHLTVSEERYNPVFKPDFSYFLLLSSNYINHITCAKRDLFLKIGGLRDGFDGAQDFDMLLQMLSENPKIIHIPQILYSWRTTPGSVSTSVQPNSEIIGYSKTAIENHLGENAKNLIVYRPEFSDRLNLSLFQLDYSGQEFSVDIVILQNSNQTSLERCLNSIINKTAYSNYRILLSGSNDDSLVPGTIKNAMGEKISFLKNESHLSDYSRAGSYNAAVSMSKAEFILFLDANAEIEEERWLSKMMAYALFKQVGAVGAKILNPDYTIRQAGIMVNLDDPAYLAYCFKGLSAHEISYCDFAEASAEKSAVSINCLLTKKSVFLRLEGFDVEDFPEYNMEVDYCLRLKSAGYSSVYSPGAEIYHHGPDDSNQMNKTDSIAKLIKKHGKYKDPYYNPNLLRDGSYRIFSKERLHSQHIYQETKEV